MIREPYNVSPYNEAKDLSQNPQFSFTFSGDALVGYDYKILNNSNKNNILKNWSATQENKYIPTVDSGKVAIQLLKLIYARQFLMMSLIILIAKLKI